MLARGKHSHGDQFAACIKVVDLAETTTTDGRMLRYGTCTRRHLEDRYRNRRERGDTTRPQIVSMIRRLGRDPAKPWRLLFQSNTGRALSSPSEIVRVSVGWYTDRLAPLAVGQSYPADKSGEPYTWHRVNDSAWRGLLACLDDAAVEPDDIVTIAAVEAGNYGFGRKPWAVFVYSGPDLQGLLAELQPLLDNGKAVRLARSRTIKSVGHKHASR